MPSSSGPATGPAMRMTATPARPGALDSAKMVEAGTILFDDPLPICHNVAKPARPERPMSENRLARETSPYLLQHKDNPVHWWPWGPEALAEAKRTGRPILLSVGYAACHWCHVMAHESFEDPATASLMNELFLNIKVDREERPDIDAIYMGALHRLGEQGGWPLTMFLDSEARPFWGGTYFPPEPRWGKPAFQQVLREVARTFREEPDKVRQNAAVITHMLKPEAAPGAKANLSDELLADVSARLVGAVDPVHGGIRGAPKFPQWNFFWLLWRGGLRYGQAAAKAAVEDTLTHISQGGIYDHLGGGFARYSVDAYWLVPHFEKMLYDNALLIDLMTEVYRENRNPLFKLRIEETVGWLHHAMIAEGGGFAASLDADSEGEEGKYYVWSAAEISEVLGPDDARFFCRVYGVKPEGNWEGHNILNRLDHLTPMSEADEKRLAELRNKLKARRAARVRPGWDDKVLADWNGLMIAAVAHAARVLARTDWLQTAMRAFAFVDGHMTTGGRLLHSYRAGHTGAPATANDYANMIWGALRLYQAANDDRYLEAARRWTGLLDRHYWDAAGGGYMMTADDTPDVIVRLKNAHDDATPNANAIMLSNLVQLFMITGDSRYLERAAVIPHAFVADLNRNLVGHAGLLANCIDLMAPQHVVVVGGKETAATLALSDALMGLSLPGAVQQVLYDPARMPLAPHLSGNKTMDGKATAYVCVGAQCSPPITDAEALSAALREQRMARAAST
jgi:uncharacterized protein YyaL (SSP411 family)